jgi:hypothetical protein
MEEFISILYFYGKKMKRIKAFFAFIILFFYILQPQFNFFPLSQILVILIFLFFLLKYKKILFEVLYSYKIVFSILIFLALWSGLLSTFYNLEFTFSFLMFKVIFYFLFSIFYLKFISYDIRLAIKLILIVIVANSFIVILEFIFPNINSAIESVLKVVGNIDFATEGIRLRGFSSGGGAALSVLNAIGFILIVYLKKIKNINSMNSIIYIFLILVSLLFIGRTGFLLITISIIYYILFNTKEQIKIITYTSVITYISLVGIIYLFPERFEYFLNTVYQWAFEFFLSSAEGKLTKSNADLLTMYHIPESVLHFLIGYGYYDGQFLLLQRSDAGYIKTITSIGFLGALLFYGMILFLMLKSLKVKELTYLLLIPLFVIILVAEIKEPFVYQQYSARVLYLFLVIPFILKNHTRSDKL